MISKQKILPRYSKRKINKMSLNQNFPFGISITTHYILFFFLNLTTNFIRTNEVNYREEFVDVYNRKNHNFLAEIRMPGQLGTVYKNKIYIILNRSPNHYTIGVYTIQNSH